MPAPSRPRNRNAVLAFDEARQQFLIRFWDPATGKRAKRRLQCGPGDRKEADRQFGLFLVEIDRTRKELEVVRPDADDPTTSDPALVGVDRCLAFYGERKAGTPNASLTGYHLQHLLRHWDGKTLAQVRGQTCRDYVTARVREGFTPKGAKVKRPVSEATARRELETLSAAIGSWHREFTLTARPMVTLPDRSDPHPDWLMESEYGRLLRVAQGDRIVGKDASGTREWKRIADPQPHLERFLEIAFATGTRSTTVIEAGWNPDPDGRRGHFNFASQLFVRKATRTNRLPHAELVWRGVVERSVLSASSGRAGTPEQPDPHLGSTVDEVRPGAALAIASERELPGRATLTAGPEALRFGAFAVGLNRERPKPAPIAMMKVQTQSTAHAERLIAPSRDVPLARARGLRLLLHLSPPQFEDQTRPA